VWTELDCVVRELEFAAFVLSTLFLFLSSSSAARAVPVIDWLGYGLVGASFNDVVVRRGRGRGRAGLCAVDKIARYYIESKSV